MKSTEIFKRTIQTYLEQRAKSDVLFAVSYAKAGKNIDDCITYILNTVQKSGCNGFADGEIYSMAVHYYDEDTVEVGKNFDCRVVVNHTVELTAEEKEEARKEAMQQAQDEAYSRLKQPLHKSKTKQPQVTNQLNLFAV
ncbi:MAG: PcfK-like family protein [Prevotellaceae bacterium]|jgi:ribosome-associated translation inhibitor RaiA|nr:PcfK-like family protein [Prevotellaceae bacterium]